MANPPRPPGRPRRRLSTPLGTAAPDPADCIARLSRQRRTFLDYYNRDGYRMAGVC